MKSKFRRITALFAVLALLTVLMLPVMAADQPAAEAEAVSGEGSASGWIVTGGSNGTLVTATEAQAYITLENTTDKDWEISLCELGQTSTVTIAPGEIYTYSAPAIYDENGDAYKLALTGTDGEMTAEYPIEEGCALDGSLDYTITLVRGVLDYYASHGVETPRWITCMIYADENGVDPERSVLAGVKGEVKAGDQALSDISILSLNDNTAAIRVGGSGTLTVSGADIKLYGDGGDDFTGIGAVFGVADSGTLTVKDSTAYTEGILRCAIFAGDEGTLNLEGVTSECAPGEYQQSVNIPSAGMASPPNGLGIWGNCRAMNLVDYATINITGCEIISQDWGALGVDDVKDGHLTVKDSTIRIKDQGYGAYSIGKCVDIFENCVFDIEYGVIGFAAAGDGAEMVLSGGSKGESRNYYGFVTHQSFNGTNSKITVTGEGTELHTALGGIIAKGRGADIEISDGAVVTADSGVLVRAQINDDTGAGSMDGTEVVNVTVKNTALEGNIIQGMGKEYEQTDSADAGAVDMGMPAGEMPAGEMPAGEMPMGEMSMGDMGAMGGMGPGGMGSSAKTESTMNVTLSQAELTGAISSATLTLAIEDGNISFDNIRDVGVVTETALEYNAFAKLNVALEQEARWVVTEKSFLMGLTIEEGSVVEAVPGYLLAMTVDGAETPIAPGEYTGEIVIDVLVDENYVPEEEAPVEEAVPAEEPEAPVEETTEVTEEEPTEEPAEAEAAEEGAFPTGALVAIAAAVAAALCALVVALKKKK